MRHLLPSLLTTAAALAPAGAAAQSADPVELQRQIAAMQAEMAALSVQVATLQDQAKAAESASRSALASTTRSSRSKS